MSRKVQEQPLTPEQREACQHSLWAVRAISWAFRRTVHWYCLDQDALESEIQWALVRSASRWDPRLGSLPGFAWPRMRGAAQDYLRKMDPRSRRRRNHLPDHPTDQSGTESVPLESSEHLEWLLSHLSGQKRAILLAVFVNGRPPSKAGQVVGLKSKSQSTKLYHAALAELRQVLSA